MMMLYRWRGGGLCVLVIVPGIIALQLILAVNLIGKDFMKEYFRPLVISGVAISGAVCGVLGRWLNRERVVEEKDGRRHTVGFQNGGHHHMWDIPVQHWLWVYVGLAILLTVIW